MTKDIIGVYFDYFGTLIDFRYAVSNMWSRIAQRFGMVINYDDPRIWAGVLKQMEESVRLEDELDKKYINFTQQDWDLLNSFVLDTIGIKSEDTSEIIAEEFQNNFSRFYRLNPGCRETLKQIKDKSIKVGLHTHGSREGVQSKMKELKIFEYFDLFIHTQDFGYDKSDIEVYEIALGAMAPNTPDKIFHIGDDIDFDVKMAQKIGMIPILFDPYNLYKLKDIRVIRKFPEILKYL